MHWTLAAATSLGFSNFGKIDFALAYTSGLKERPSIRHLTLGTYIFILLLNMDPGFYSSLSVLAHDSKT